LPEAVMEKSNAHPLPTGAPRQPSGDDTRARIVSAMMDLCCERGFRRVKLPMLLERAGVDRDAFERYFADVEDCYCQIYKELRDQLMAMIAEAVAEQPTRQDRIRVTAYTMVGHLEEDERRTQFMSTEVRNAGDRAAVLMEEAFEEMFELLDSGRVERDHPSVLSRATAEAIGGTIFFQMLAAFQQGSMAAVRVKIPEMMYVAVLPYLGEEAAREELEIPPHGRAPSEPTTPEAGDPDIS
jgi:AcrR family transcriptional regulator